VGGPIVTPPLDPRLLETLVREYWVPLVLFDPGWRVVVWNRGAQDLFGLPLEQAVGRPLEETGILPEGSYGSVLRARVTASEEVMLMDEPRSGDGTRRSVVHRFRRIAADDELLGFLCASSFRDPAELGSNGPEPAGVALPPPLEHDWRNSIQVISNHSELLLSETAASPFAPRVREIMRAVEHLMDRTGQLRKGEARSQEHGEEGQA
jgi:PAS domain-containing protein